MDSGDLKYVAISYRWGELHETTVDTHLGYLASITSFGLDSFFQLCRTMVEEVDLKHMDYVWVDAICVNQGDYEKRKATIYQMTNIYHRANYIVAVPDFHLRHLEKVNKKNAEIIQGSMKYSTYIYHLIHGNTNLLEECDSAFLDEHRVPDDRHLRYLLTRYTEHFADGFTTCKEHDEHYDADLTLDHIYETNLASQKKVKHHHGRKLYKKILKKIGIGKNKKEHPLDNRDVSELHKCDKVHSCPLSLFGGDPESYEEVENKADEHAKYLEKRQKDLEATKWRLVIPERSASIRQSVDFLSDLIQDWSTRVWVISEYGIAQTKKSGKMKYWFIQLSQASFGKDVGHHHRHDRFFEFDFSGDAPIISSGSSINLYRTPTSDSTVSVGSKRKRESFTVFQSFHATVQKQLNHQTFLEKMLKSKASRNEDRMHAILPLSEYKHKLVSKEQVGQWHINDLISVKLQLYHWTTTKDKWQLLFLSNFTDHVSGTLPTFATSNIVWPGPETYPTLTDDGQYKCNFDLTRDDSIQLTALDNTTATSIKKQYKLTIKPKEYYQHKNYQVSLLSGNQGKDEAMLRRLIQLDFPTDLPDMICIPNFTGHFIQDDPHPMTVQTKSIYLIGCSAKNKWILKFECDFQQLPLANLQTWERHACDVTNALAAGFDIY
ncbi:hypothetical protein BCR42DRAFT_426248 [Absidia repens]|uniref:Heterokaryon incompatibility domain-containing protein n=1 Tax=Absidia repens TaxID=90262 RepID=A0A1X2I1K8_9FUNG|nr:hypothetical protein BCR42DRAFT_426248 [Absidia repens]